MAAPLPALNHPAPGFSSSSHVRSGCYLRPPYAAARFPRREAVLSAAKPALSHCLSETHIDLAVPGLKSKSRGKVRDIYDSGEYLVLATTDRQGAFDRVLASTLFKGQVRTPDSSRYWIFHSYEERLSIGLEPENVDKEFLRLWFKDHCNLYVEKVLPAAPEELICEFAWRYAVHLLKSLIKRYIFLFETITNSTFEMPDMREPVHDQICGNVKRALPSLR